MEQYLLFTYIKSERIEKLMHKHYIGITTLGILVLIVCIVGFSIIGSPISQKAIRFDETRIADLSAIKTAVEDYYTKNENLPSSLSDLTFTYSPEPKDPETKQGYTYQKVTAIDYKLCSTFSTDSEEVSKKNQTNSRYNYSYDYLTTANKHKKGYDCITYQLPSYLTTKTPRRSVLPVIESFKFTKPTPSTNICLEQTYEIEWQASYSVNEVVPILVSVEDPSQTYSLFPEAKAYTTSINNSMWKGSRSWIIGNVMDKNKKQLQAEPGTYKFTAAITQTSGGTYTSSSPEFIISDCSDPNRPGSPNNPLQPLPDR